MILAAKNGYEDIVEELIQHGANVNDRNEDGKFMGYKKEFILNIVLTSQKLPSCRVKLYTSLPYLNHIIVVGRGGGVF